MRAKGEQKYYIEQRVSICSIQQGHAGGWRDGIYWRNGEGSNEDEERIGIYGKEMPCCFPFTSFLLILGLDMFIGHFVCPLK